jgi:two-component system, response regulator YesN
MKMSILIVDDEAHWVDSLVETIDWPELGIDKVFKAYSGFEALQVLLDEPVDILLTDINMPRMSGLELIQKARESVNSIKCILLTGYSDFEYTKSAIKHQVIDYLLKPIKDDELFQTIRNAVKQIKEEQIEISATWKMQQALNEAEPVFRSNLLLEYLQGFQYPESEWKEKIATYNLAYHYGDNCHLIMFHVDENWSYKDRKSINLLDYFVTKMIEETFEPHFHTWICMDQYGHYISLLKGKVNQRNHLETIQNTARQLQSRIKTYLKYTISIIISHPIQFPDLLTSQYYSCLEKFNPYVENKKESLTINTPKLITNQVKSLVFLYEPPRLFDLLDSGRFEEAKDKLSFFFHEITQKEYQSLEYLVEFSSYITSIFMSFMHRSGLSLSELDTDSDFLMSGNIFRSIQNLRNWTFHSLDYIMENLDPYKNISRQEIIHRIHEYVENNMSEDISLNAIAQYVHFHPTHISKIYKLGTGETLSSYIQRLRMEKAKHLILNTQDKIYEIGARLGYVNPPYFIKVFSKYYGMTPQECRNLNKFK